MLVMKSRQLNEAMASEDEVMAISLEENNTTLDEVMVVAYGTAKKHTLEVRPQR